MFDYNLIWSSILVSSFLFGSTVYSLIDCGIANVLCVETLRHGTDPVAYINIRLNGTDRKYDESTVGRLTPRIHQRTYILKEDCDWIHSIWPRFFAFTSGVRRCDSLMSSFPKPIRNISSCVGGVISCVLTPTINFRFRKDEITQDRFELDRGFIGAPDDITPAYCTKFKIEAWRIGVLGSILSGVDNNLFHRIKNNPMRFVKGLTQVTGAALAISYLGTEAISKSFLAGVALG